MTENFKKLYQYLPVIIIYPLLFYCKINAIDITVISIITGCLAALFWDKLNPAFIFLFSIFPFLLNADIYELGSGSVFVSCLVSGVGVYIITSLILLLVIALMHGKLMKFEATGIEKYILVIFMIIILSTIRGILITSVVYPFEAFRSIFIIFLSFFLFYLIFNLTRTIDEIKLNLRLIFLILFVSGIISFTGVYFYGYLKTSPVFAFSEPQSERISALLHFPFIFLAIAMIFTPNKMEKIFYILTAYTSYCCVLYSYSFLSFVLTITLLIAALLFFAVIKQFKKSLVVLIFLIIISCSVSFLMNTELNKYFGNNFSIKQEYRIPSIDGNLMKITLDEKPNINLTEDSIFNKSREIVQEYPVFGLGITGAEYFEKSFYNMLSQTGIAGISAVLFLIIVLIIKTYRLEKYYKNKDKFIASFLYGYIFFISGSLALSFIDDIFNSDAIIIAMLILTAFVLRIETIFKNSSGVNYE